jgi:hypothetical protein
MSCRRGDACTPARRVGYGSASCRRARPAPRRRAAPRRGRTARGATMEQQDTEPDDDVLLEAPLSISSVRGSRVAGRSAPVASRCRRRPCSSARPTRDDRHVPVQRHTIIAPSVAGRCSIRLAVVPQQTTSGAQLRALGPVRQSFASEHGWQWTVADLAGLRWTGRSGYQDRSFPHVQTTRRRDPAR